MASLQRQPSRQRSSSQRRESIEDIATDARQAPPSHTSQHDEEEPSKQEPEQANEHTPPRFTSADDDPSVKKCWICFSDSTEDTVETSPWRAPCPCALVAHEECLLDWIADSEAPKNSRVTGMLKKKIQCPQCKGEIKLARPRSYLVDLVRTLDRASARAVLPFGVSVLSFYTLRTLYDLSFLYGIHATCHIFGIKDAARIFGPGFLPFTESTADLDLSASSLTKQVMASLAHKAKHWRLWLGTPLIMPLIILSRTNWYISETMLTVLPTVFVALQPVSPEDLFRFTQWPPSAAMSFALLPYVRQAYNVYYERVWGARVRQWKREVLPSTSQAQAEPTAERDPVQAIEDAADNAGDVFEIRVDGGIWEEDEAAPAPAVPAAAQPAQAEMNDEPEVEADAAPAPDVPDNRNMPADNDAAQPAPPGRHVHNERRLTFSPITVAQNVFGALAFPTIADLSGELLKLVLPTSWTAAPSGLFIGLGPRPGLRVLKKGVLQEKWGRSLVGGCLFVVVKDAIMLYVRWKMAQMHRNRRVLDYDRSLAKAKS